MLFTQEFIALDLLKDDVDGYDCVDKSAGRHGIMVFRYYICGINFIRGMRDVRVYAEKEVFPDAYIATHLVYCSKDGKFITPEGEFWREGNVLKFGSGTWKWVDDHYETAGHDNIFEEFEIME